MKLYDYHKLKIGFYCISITLKNSDLIDQWCEWGGRVNGRVKVLTVFVPCDWLRPNGLIIAIYIYCRFSCFFLLFSQLFEFFDETACNWFNLRSVSSQRRLSPLCITRFKTVRQVKESTKRLTGGFEVGRLFKDISVSRKNLIEYSTVLYFRTIDSLKNRPKI